MIGFYVSADGCSGCEGSGKDTRSLNASTLDAVEVAGDTAPVVGSADP